MYLIRGLHNLAPDVVVLVTAAVVDEDPLEVGDGEEVLLRRVAALLSLLSRVERAAKEEKSCRTFAKISKLRPEVKSGVF